MKPKADPHFKRQNQRQLLDDKQRLLTEFIDLQHPMALLANRIDWSRFEPHWHRRFSDASGPRAAPARLAAGLLLLKHMEGLSDEALMMDWVCNRNNENLLINGCTELYLCPKVNQANL